MKNGGFAWDGVPPPWSYTVIVGAWPSGTFRDIFLGAPKDDDFGGADNDAFQAGVLPKGLDILVPEGVSQEKLLRGYDADTGELATVYAVPPPSPSGLPKKLIIAAVAVIIAVILALVLVRRK